MIGSAAARHATLVSPSAKVCLVGPSEPKVSDHQYKWRIKFQSYRPIDYKSDIHFSFVRTTQKAYSLASITMKAVSPVRLPLTTSGASWLPGPLTATGKSNSSRVTI
jgi:hypothetical protein